MTEGELSTADKILKTAVALIEEKGLHAVTMKEIATAVGISEMTVFRHFSSKKGILEAAIEKCSFIPTLREIETQLTWELEHDLLLLCEIYQKIMHRNRSIILILMQERAMLSDENRQELPPYHLKEFITKYFKEMQVKGKIAAQNIDALTLAFMMMNFGYFYSKTTLSNDFINVLDETYIDVCVQLFVKSLKI